MKIVAVTLLGLLIATSSSAAAATKAGAHAKLAQGAAKGTLKINGKSANLKFAYLSSEKHDAGIGLIITVSDVPLTANARDINSLINGARDHGTHAIVLKVDDKKEVYSAKLFDKAIDGWPTTDLIGVNEFSATQFTKNAVQGRAFMKEPLKTTDDTIFYDVSFNAGAGM